VSPVDAQATAGIGFPSRMSSFTIDTSTVMPRSLKEPVWVLPHCLIQRSSTPTWLPYRSAQKRLVLPSYMDTTLSSRRSGSTHSFLPHTPEP
jgi:hypothetical protein